MVKITLQWLSFEIKQKIYCIYFCFYFFFKNLVMNILFNYNKRQSFLKNIFFLTILIANLVVLQLLSIQLF